MNILASAKSLILLDLMNYIYQAVRNMPHGYIKVYIDHLKGDRFLKIPIKKTSQCILAGTSLLYEINEIIKKLRYQIDIECTKDYPKKVPQFREDLVAYLIYKCDMQANQIRMQAESGDKPLRIEHFGMYTLMQQEQLRDNTITEAIRAIDAVNEEKLYAVSQLGPNVEFIDLEVRNYFSEGASASKLKYIVKVNYYGKRSICINKGIVSKICPRYIEKEDWHYMVRYKALTI